MSAKSKTKPGEAGSPIKKSGQGDDRIQYLASLVENISDALISTDMDFNILEWNTAAEGMYGWRAAEVAGRPMSMFIQSEYGSGSREETVKAVLEQGIWKGELTQNRKDGARFPVMASVSLVKDKTDRPIGFVSINRDINEHKRAEKMLKESEEKYRALLETSTDIILTHDITGRITYINPSGLKITEYSAADLIGSIITDILPPEERVEMEKRALARRRRETGTYEYETKFISKSGREVSIEVHSAPIIKEGQKPEFLINARDITERKLTEEAVANVQKRFQTLIENAPDGIALLGLDGKLRQVTPSTQQILGYTLEDAQNQEPALLTHPDDLPALLGLLNDLIQNPGKVVRTEYRFRHKDGSWRWLESTISNMLAEPGLNAIVFNYRDITERKQAEDLLYESEEKYQLIADNTDDWVYWIAPDGNLRYISPSCSRMTGYSAAEFVNYPKLIEAIIYADDRPSLELHSAKIRKEDQPDSLEFRVITKSGEARWINHSCSPIYTKEGIYAGRRATNRDITERKRAEEALRESEERFRSLYENATIGMYRTTPDGKIQLANPALIRMLGYSSFEELCQRDLEKEGYEPGYQRDIFRRQIEELGMVTGLESAWSRKDGTFIFVRESARAAQDAEGKVLHYEGTVEDITERKRAQDAIQKSEKKYRLLHESMLDGFVSVGLDGKFLECNEVYRNMLGYSEAELARLTYVDITPEKWHAYEAELVESQILKRGYSDVYEKEYRRKNGTVFPAELHTVLVRDETGKPASMWALVRDITDRKWAEKNLRKSEERYRTTLNNMMEGCQIIDYDWRYLYVNDVAAQQGHKTPGELLMHTMMDVYPGIEDTEMFSVLKRCMEGQRPARMENKFVYPDGVFGWFELSIQPVPEGLFVLSIDITERKRAEEQLTTSEMRYRRLFESAKDGILILNVDTGEIVDVNPFLTDKLGYLHSEFLGKKLWEIGVFKDIIANRDSFLKLQEERYIRYENLPLETKDGRLFWVEFVSNVYDVGGRQVIQCNIRDITERKQAEDALRASEERFASAFLSSPNAIAISRTADGQFIDVNEAACRLFGYSREELVGHKSLDLGLTNAETRQKIIEEIKSRGTLRDFEITITASGGIQRNVLESMEAIRIGGEQCLLTNMIDITDRKQAEKKLEQQNRRLKALREIDTAILASDSVESIVDAALSHIRELIGCRRAGTALIDWEANEAVIFDVRMAGETAVAKGSRVPLMLLQSMPQALSKPLANNQPVLIHDLTELPDLPPFLQILSKEGLRSVCILPLFSQGSQIGTFNLLSETPGFFDEEKISLGREVANQVAIALTQNHLVEALRKLNSELEERVAERTAQFETANKELEAFAYSVSHDLRAPLRAITGYTNILLEDYEPAFDAEGKRVCGVIANEAQRMGQLIDDLLTFSRLSRKEIHASTIDMQAMLQSVFNELTTPESRERIDLQIGSLPSVKGDAALIRQAWINLLSNSLKFTSKKERAVIEVGSMEGKDETVYSVRDNGAGFDMQYADKLFGVFQRLHSEHEFEGTGVGLAIVQRVVLRHGGRVWAEGRVDQGAVFYFALPRNEASHE